MFSCNTQLLDTPVPNLTYTDQFNFFTRVILLMIGKTLTSMAETYYKEKDERLCIKDPELKGLLSWPKFVLH